MSNLIDTTKCKTIPTKRHGIFILALAWPYSLIWSVGTHSIEFSKEDIRKTYWTVLTSTKAIAFLNGKFQWKVFKLYWPLNVCLNNDLVFAETYNDVIYCNNIEYRQLRWVLDLMRRLFFKLTIQWLRRKT